MSSLYVSDGIYECSEDRQNGFFVPRPFANVMGMNTTVLYFQIRHALRQNDSFRVVKDVDGRWHKQSAKWMCIQTALSFKQFRAAKDKLIQYGLIRTKKAAGFDATTLYQLTERSKHERLSAFVHALYNAMIPDSETKDVWYAFYFEHPEIVDEFKGLVRDFDQYIPPADYTPQEPEQKKEAPAGFTGPPEMVGTDVDDRQTRKKLSPIGEKVKEKFAKKPPKKDVQIPHDEFVDYWNDKPHVPKVKYGCATYARLAHLLKLFRYKELGIIQECVLSKEEQNKLDLRGLYRNGPDTEYCGPKRKPRMSREEVFKHLDLAAKVFDPQYTPSNAEYVAKLKRGGAVSFFWCEHPDKSDSRNTVRYSPFLNFITIGKPKRLGESEIDSLYAGLDDDAKPMYDVIVNCLNISRGRREGADLRNVLERKRVISIIRQYMRYFEENRDYLQDRLRITKFQQVIDRVEHYGEDKACSWQDMPVSVFAENGQVWESVFEIDDDDVAVIAPVARSADALRYYEDDGDDGFNC